MQDLFARIDALPDNIFVAWFVVALFLFALWNAVVKLTEDE